MRTVFRDITLLNNSYVLEHLTGVDTLRLWPDTNQDIKAILSRLCSDEEIPWVVVGRVLARLFPNLRAIVDVGDRGVARGETIDLLLHNVLLLLDS